MAMDSSWDNSGLPPRKKGMPIWVKILGGCGILFVLVLGGCAVATYSCVRSVSKLGEKQWPAYVAAVKALEDPASTKDLFEQNPGLQQEFKDEAAFEQQVAEWRPSIQTPPAQMPPLMSGRAFSAYQTSNSHVQIGTLEHEDPNDGKPKSAAGFRMQNGQFLVIKWEEGRITKIQFERRSRD